MLIGNYRTTRERKKKRINKKRDYRYFSKFRRLLVTLRVFLEDFVVAIVTCVEEIT